MCDYSLCGLPTRLAVEGEELVVHRFRTGSVGLASPADIYRSKPPLTPASRRRLWDDVKSLLFGDGPGAPPAAAVCLPPGARLILKDIPRDLQRQWNIGGEEGEVEYLRVFINQLRKKIEPDPSHPKFLLTEPSSGYRFAIKPSTSGK